MARGGLVAIIALALTASATMWLHVSYGQARPDRNAQKKKGQSKVSTALQLTIAAGRPEALIGESIPITVTARNTSAAPAATPDPDETFAFSVVLRPAKDPASGYTLSKAGAQASRYVDEPPPALAIPTVPLAPGDSRTYRTDLADMAVQPLPAGEYTIAAALEIGEQYFESPGTPLTIAPPRVRALAGEFTGRGLNQVMVHETASGAGAVYQREGRADLPADGPWHRRADGPEGKTRTGVAAAVVLHRPDGVYWYGWLAGDEFSAGVAQGGTVFKTLGPQPLGLTDVQLHRAGWQHSPNEATFAAMGKDKSGKVSLAMIEMHAKGNAVVRAVDLGVPDAPRHWAAQFDPKGNRLIIAGVSERAGSSRIWSRGVDRKTGAAADLTPIAAVNGKAAGLAVAPLARGGDPQLNVLFGPTGEKNDMQLVRFPLAGGAPGGQWTFTAPRDAAGHTPSEWGIGDGVRGDPRVLAFLNGKICICNARDGSWGELAAGAPRSDWMRILENSSGKLFAIWVDTAAGVQYRPLP